MAARLTSVFIVAFLGLGVHLAAAQHTTAVVGQAVACTNGSAAGYGCSNVNLQALVPVSVFSGALETNDVWGWVDPETQREYALVGLNDGTAFVDVTDPVNPRYLGKLPTHSTATVWRDIKTYANHAFIVSEASGHGMQVFDLTQLRNVNNSPVTFSETAHYDKVNKVHNIVINEDTGFAYTVGNNGDRHPDLQGTDCSWGYHMINIQNPAAPTFAGCFNSSVPRRSSGNFGYTHDAQCVVYHGPDEAYQGREVCLGADESGISIADVTDKSTPTEISTATYPNVAYAHQGWLTEDHRYYIQDDELDGGQMRTLIWDVMELDDPQLLTEYFAPTQNIDHNLYVRGNYVFQSNYTEGLRILDISNISQPVEVAFFDTVPGSDARNFNGSWSNYPYFPSGNIVVTSRGEGLFVVRPTTIATVDTEQEEIPEAFTLSAAYPNPFNPETTVTVSLPAAQPVTVGVYDMLGRRVALLFEGLLEAGTHPLRFDASGLSGGTYVIRAESGKTVVSRRAVLVK
ncbi:MAG TPA: choice-of-anchor B family protein [Rhodothermales bacterium]|nr:choice-of-anchor B family protein [Rhodothermales bacterium]